MTLAPDLQQIAQTAERILRDQLGRPLTLVQPQLLKDQTRSLVIRCTVRTTAAAAELPASVIVKQMRDDRARGFSDWASLAYLAEIPAVRGLVPAFLAGDPAERLWVMTDLGGSVSLDEILRQPDPPRAQATLCTLARQMARLSGATLANEARFTTIRNALPEATGLGRHAEATQWRQGQDKILGWFAAGNCPLPPGFLACLEQVATLYAEPGPFLSFSHGDPAPSNNHIRNEQVRLLDFEYGGFRHALYDITGWNILCPLPRPCVQAMSNTFQQELARTCPDAADDVLYAEAWAALCAFRALAILTWIPPTVLQTNRPWVDESWTSRHAVLAAMIRLRAATVTSATLAPLGEAAGRLCHALLRQWPEFAQAEDIATRWPALTAL